MAALDPAPRPAHPPTPPTAGWAASRDVAARPPRRSSRPAPTTATRRTSARSRRARRCATPTATRPARRRRRQRAPSKRRRAAGGAAEVVEEAGLARRISSGAPAGLPGGLKGVSEGRAQSGIRGNKRLRRLTRRSETAVATRGQCEEGSGAPEPAPAPAPAARRAKSADERHWQGVKERRGFHAPHKNSASGTAWGTLVTAASREGSDWRRPGRPLRHGGRTTVATGHEPEERGRASETRRQGGRGGRAVRRQPHRAAAAGWSRRRRASACTSARGLQLQGVSLLSGRFTRGHNWGYTTSARTTRRSRRRWHTRATWPRRRRRRRRQRRRKGAPVARGRAGAGARRRARSRAGGEQQRSVVPLVPRSKRERFADILASWGWRRCARCSSGSASRSTPTRSRSEVRRRHTC